MAVDELRSWWRKSQGCGDSGRDAISTEDVEKQEVRERRKITSRRKQYGEKAPS